MNRTAPAQSEVVARFAPGRTSIALVALAAAFLYVGRMVVLVVTGQAHVAPITVTWLALCAVIAPGFVRETAYAAKALLTRKGAAVYVKDGRVVYLAPSYFSVPVEDFEFELVGLRGKGLWVRNQLELRQADGSVRYVPLFWLSEPKRVIAERLRTLGSAA